jgi:uncharacterized protein (DUF2236 family)
MTLLSGPYHLPDFVDRQIALFLQSGDAPAFDFLQPDGEPALVPPSSISWMVFKNPLSLFVGGVAAVIMEFAVPGVRSGVWDHSSFRNRPVERLQRTGLAAMVTVYGAETRAREMIAHVVRKHEKVTGTTDQGVPYSASDVALLNWVQATAIFGFAEAYSRYVRPLERSQMDRCFAEGKAAAMLYGAVGAPQSVEDFERLVVQTEPHMNASPIVFEFLEIINKAPALPAPVLPLQRLLVRAAVDIVPDPIRRIVGLDHSYGLKSWQRPIVHRGARLADRIVLADAPPAQSCRRLGLPADYLYRS